MAGAVLEVGPFLEQEFLCAITGFEHERLLGSGVEDPLLNHVQLDLQDLLDLGRSEWLEGDDLIQTVDKFWRKLAPRGINPTSANLGAQLVVHRSILALPRSLAGVEAEPWTHQ